jgi:hypothetical protein
LKFDLPASSGYFPVEEVHGQIPYGQTGWLGEAACPPDQCLDPGKKFRESEGLGDIVVASGLKSLDPVVNRTLRTQDDHRCGDFLLPHLFDHGQPIQFGKHDIDDGNIVRLGQDEREAFFSVEGMVHRIPCCLQPFDNE